MNYETSELLGKRDAVRQRLEPYEKAEVLLEDELLRRYVATIGDVSDDALVECYIEVRDVHLRRLKQEMEKREDICKRRQEAIEQELARRLHERGAQNTKTSHGVAFFQDTVSCRLEDPLRFRNYVIDSAQWELADWRASKEACRQFQEESKTASPPPGVKIERITKVHVRKS